MGTRDPMNSEGIRKLLFSENADDSSSNSTVVDGSDADPDFVLSDEEGRNVQESSLDDEDNLMELRRTENETAIEQIHNEEIYFVERTKKCAPNAWSSKPPQRNVRIPARNIIRTVSGVKGPARALGVQPSKKQVWDLLFDEQSQTLC
ncbi:hypothetical protein J6590_088413 [Homalodisca vitripennis]|nr:hypothetical protein J6590_088413 [Homalodisca vitripennis]